MIGRVVTIATGRPIYHELAANCARSFLRWNRDGGLRFTLVTDAPDRVPPDLRGIDVVTVRPGECGLGFSPKLHLDRFVHDVPAVFIDSDCLVLGSLAPVFTRFRGQPFVMLGGTATSGQFYADIAPLLSRVQLPWLPVFVGSFFYWEPGPAAREVFALSRDFEARYDALGLDRMRGATADEPVMALALARCGIVPVADDGTIKADAHLYAYPPEIDALRGHIRFPRPPQPLSEAIPTPPADAEPLIAHFNAYYAYEPPYVREALILRLVQASHWPAPFARAFAAVTKSLPHFLRTAAKNACRPLYRRLFGVRGIAKDPREH